MIINLEYLALIILVSINLYLLFKLIKNTEENNNLSNNNDNSLENLKDSIKQLEQTTSKSSDNMNEMYTLLTKGGSVAGKFGEINLKVILESAGFKKGVNYDEQKGIGGSIPDIIVKLPDGKKVIIDSKVSLSDYNGYLNANDQINKDNFYKKHQNSVKNHIKSLTSSNYRNLFNDESLDLIVMFMPIEGAYILACDEDMIKKAVNEKIAIVGPTTLIAILQIISRIWSSKRQSEATNLIIKAATDIYDKTRLVGDAFEDLEKSLEQANKSIDSGKKRTQNLVNKVEKMRTIGGLEPTKNISDKLRIIDKD
ncbi:MAG: DNA recombination protein RmuC [Gammaproteobacteria bacterium]|nr:DNA recombination protein RmuC [Gammaproteobacteria bacterium]MBL6818985.1 DNA recombination protein RmuC [Gammaproteobacteria bacterium]MBL6898968.1 DNA recombination protein RmuC [Gammaproteobacteria bacterium]